MTDKRSMIDTYEAKSVIVKQSLILHERDKNQIFGLYFCYEKYNYFYV